MEIKTAWARLKKGLALSTVIIAALASTACSQLFLGFEERAGASSNLVEFLYPEGQKPPAPDGELPRLQLPLRVGLAFVPEQNAYHSALTAAHKQTLLESVRARFDEKDFIAEIQIIPENYLAMAKGFDGLEQVSRLYGVDVVALVSYDQISRVGDTSASFLYWTIVGAYIIPASDLQVQTLVDTAVFDMRTRKLLFRAAGVDTADRLSSAVNLDSRLRETRGDSVSRASEQMTENLARELENFQEKVKRGEGAVVVSRGGGGAFSPLWLVAVVTLLLLAMVSRRRSNGCSATATEAQQ